MDLQLKTVAATTQPTGETSDVGEFRALFATWEEDRERDIIHKGAFRDTIRRWRRSGKRIPLHWQHESGPDKIIGHVDPQSLQETSEGLVGNGWVDLKQSSLGREVWRLVKGGVIGLSFGYLPTLAHKRATGGRDLHELDVFEFTLTPAPMSFATAILAHKGLQPGDEQRARAALAEQEYEAGELPDVPAPPTAPEPEPDPEPVIPGARELRDRARDAERFGSQMARAAEAQRLPDVPPAPPKHEVEPDPKPVIPETLEQRERARETERLGGRIVRTAEAQRLPDVPEPPPEPVLEAEPEPVIPEALEQRDRAREAERFGSQMTRRAEAQRLPDIPEPPPEPILEAEPEPVIPEALEQRDRAREAERYIAKIERLAEELELPDLGSAPPAVEETYEEPVVPDSLEQRDRARDAERYAAQMRRQAEELQLPDVPPPPPEPQPVPEPEPELPPDAASQRDRAHEAERFGKQLRRRAEEQRLPSLSAPAQEPVPEPEPVPDLAMQRARARATERFGKQLDRQAEEERLPALPDEPVELEPDPGDPRLAALEARMEWMETKHAQTEMIDAERQRKRARAVEREMEEQALMDLVQPRRREEKATMKPEPFSRSRTSNWVARAGGLPTYIQHIAHDLLESGHAPDESRAIQMAIGICQRWARGEGNVTAETRAKAAAAIAQWEKMKASARGKSVAALLDELPSEELVALFDALSERVDSGQSPGKRLAVAPRRSRDDADVTGGNGRRVDPLRQHAEAVELAHVSGGISERKSPPPAKPAPVPEPELSLQELTERMRDEMLRDLSGVDDIE